MKKQINALGGLNKLYSSQFYKDKKLKSLKSKLKSSEKKRAKLLEKVKQFKGSKCPGASQWLKKSKSEKAELDKEIKELKKGIRDCGGSCKLSS